MVDILGPSGQPLQPNPFTQGNSQSTSLNVNTSQADKALDDLKARYDMLSKSFGANWEKTVEDKTKAEEQFFNTLGNLVKANENVLKTQQAQYFKLLDARTQAELDSYKTTWAYANTSADGRAQYERKKWQDNENEKVKIAAETERKISDERRKEKFGATALQKLGKDIGGVGGSAISQVGGVLGAAVTNPMAFLIGAAITTALETSIANARFTRVGAALSNAGMSLSSGAGAGTEFQSRIFGGSASKFGMALGREQQAAILEQMAGSRTMINETKSGKGAGAFIGNIGLFANILPDAAEEAKLFTDATKSLGFSQKDITNTFVTSRVNAEKLNITQLDAIHTQIEMQKALRNITNDGAVAVNVLSSISGYLDSIGATETEKARIGVAVAQSGANLSLPQLAGMFAMTHGGKMPTDSEMFGVNGMGGMMGKGGTGVFGLLGSFLTKVGTQFKDPMQRDFAADALRQQFIPGLRMQDTPQFFKLAEGLMRGEKGIDYEKEFKKMAGNTPQAMVQAGIDKLAATVDPIQKIERMVSNFWTDLDKFFQRHFGDNQKTSSWLHDKPQMGVGKNPSAGRKF